MPKIVVIDLSHHNTIPKSLQEAKAAGVLGVIHKATESITYTDSKYDARRSLAKDAGMLWGAYHFMRAGNVQDQVEHFLENAEPDANTLLACDYEDHNIPLSQLVEFMQRVEEESNRLPILYSGHVLKEKMNGQAVPDLNKYLLWLAQYGSEPVCPPGWDEPWLWQYSDGAAGPTPHTVPGINPPVDCNHFFGTDEELAEQWSGGASLPGPEPAPVARTVYITVSKPIDVKVEVEVVDEP